MELRAILFIIRKWIWFILLACFIGGAAGFIVTFLLPKTYVASTTVYLSTLNRSDYSTVTGDQQKAKAFALIPQSSAVLNATLQNVGDNSLTRDQLASMLSVSNNRDTQFVVIQVRDSDPQRAARLSNAVAKQSIAQYQTTGDDSKDARSFIKQEIDKLQAEIKDLEKEQSDLQKAVAGDPTKNTLLGQVTKNLADKRTLYNQTLNTYANMASTEATILQEAQVPTEPAGTSYKTGIIIGALAGLIAIAAVILFIEQTSGTARTDVRQSPISDLPTIVIKGQPNSKQLKQAMVGSRAIDKMPTGKMPEDS